MTNLVQTILQTLAQNEAKQSQKACLFNVSQALYTCLQPENVVFFELIPETGGTLRSPPVCTGSLTHKNKSKTLFTNLSARGMVNDFIRHWQVVFEKDATSWLAISDSDNDDATDLSRFYELETLQAFIFLPVSYDDERLAMFFLNYREGLPARLPDIHELTTCGMVIGMYLQRYFQSQDHAYRFQKQMAVAHTLYGQAALQFIGQIDLLQTTLEDSFEQAVPTAVTEQLTGVKHSIFSVMRELVINAAGNMLVDLESMSLGEALHTTASALERAWPSGTAVTIDIPRIPPIIERQPQTLKEILYTVILELIGNAVKHGGPAPYISVDVTYDDYTVHLMVLDHGRGFNPHEQTYSAHGLGFWESYIEHYLNGTFHVASQPNFGTAVQIQIPVI